MYIHTTLPLYTSPEPISDPDTWIEQRRNIRTMTISVEALKNAAQASDEFKKSFQLLLEDKFTLARANALLADIESLIKVAEDIKKATSSSTTGE